MSVFIAMLVVGLLFSLIFVGLSLAQRFFAVQDNPLINTVNELLPQTQCAQCGYPGCKPYAQAIIEQNEAINRCPPGGDATIQALATLLQRSPLPLDPERGTEAPPTRVIIREETCIGCTLCIQACPVDAIIGAAKQMHTVLTDICTGCNLCLPPCPVDCIEIVPREAHHAH
jgi:electron transport complex protein RnfB